MLHNKSKRSANFEVLKISSESTFENMKGHIAEAIGTSVYKFGYFIMIISQFEMLWLGNRCFEYWFVFDISVCLKQILTLRFRN